MKPKSKLKTKTKTKIQKASHCQKCHASAVTLLKPCQYCGSRVCDDCLFYCEGCGLEFCRTCHESGYGGTSDERPPGPYSTYCEACWTNDLQMHSRRLMSATQLRTAERDWDASEWRRDTHSRVSRNVRDFFAAYSPAVHFLPMFSTNCEQMYVIQDAKRAFNICSVDNPVYIFVVIPNSTYYTLHEYYDVAQEELISCPGNEEIHMTWIAAPRRGAVRSNVAVKHFKLVKTLRWLQNVHNVEILAHGDSEKGYVAALDAEEGSAILVLANQGVISTSLLIRSLFTRLLRDMVGNQNQLQFARLLHIWRQCTRASGSEEADILSKRLFANVRGVGKLTEANSRVHQDPRTGQVTFHDDGKPPNTVMVGNGAALNRLELSVLQAMRDVAASGCSLEVLIDMHGKIEVERALITAPEGMCAEIIRSAPAGCVAFGYADNFATRGRQEFFDVLHSKGKVKIPKKEYAWQLEEANKARSPSDTDAHYAKRRRLKRFLEQEPAKGHFCRLVVCKPEQPFFDKRYTHEDYMTVTMQNLWETKDLDLFPIMRKCGYTASSRHMYRAWLFQFFSDLGVASVTFYDKSCATTNEPDVTREAAFLSLHASVLGGNGARKLS